MESSSSKRVRTPLANGTQVPSCLVDGCTSDLTKCRDYHRRHKVCELHSKTAKVYIKGHEQRFCQQCSRFHCLVEFDEGKRSCRKRLEGHNRRRRKPQPDPLSARLFSQHQGARHLQLGGSQILSTGAVKPENDPMLYASQSCLNFRNGENVFAGSVSHSYDDGNHFPFLGSVGHSIIDAGSVLGSNTRNHKMYSDKATQDSNRARSLLSSPEAETQEIGLSHMVQPIRYHSEQATISLNFSNFGRESGAGESVLVSDGGSNANFQVQGVFQMRPDGLSSANSSHQTLSFPWE